MGLSVYFTVWSIWDGNPRAGTSSDISSHCWCVTSNNITEIRNDRDSDEFEIADDNEDTEEPQHIQEDTENPENPTNIVDEEDK